MREQTLKAVTFTLPPTPEKLKLSVSVVSDKRVVEELYTKDFHSQRHAVCRKGGMNYEVPQPHSKSSIINDATGGVRPAGGVIEHGNDAAGR